MLSYALMLLVLLMYARHWLSADFVVSTNSTHQVVEHEAQYGFQG